MTSWSDEFAEYQQPNLDLQDTEDDYFELLSAYIDGEANSDECQKIQQLLDNDPEVKKTYMQLLKLQGEMQNLAVPVNQSISSNLLSEQVFAQVDRSARHRKLLLWGGSIIASTFIAALSGFIPGFNSPNLKLAESPKEENIAPALTIPTNIAPTVMVAVTLNEPTVTIPKAAISNFTFDVDSDYKY